MNDIINTGGSMYKICLVEDEIDLSNLIKLYLEKEGYEVVDTIFADETPKDSDAALYYLSRAIEAMSKVDGLVFMPGWQDARGCRIEFQIALEYGKFIKQA